ncbi:hypothetical protein ACTJKE_09435 [Ensifer sp. 22521]|uniref:hypothetical protein n=1 Tax=Ensifer sp. 22521 TaxID=3453935 RepID=UPI003F84B189
MNTYSFEDVKLTVKNVVDAFVRTFGRAPTPKEQEILVSALVRYFDEPDAPTTRLQ